jgi:hypothetical protein
MHSLLVAIVAFVTSLTATARQQPRSKQRAQHQYDLISECELLTLLQGLADVLADGPAPTRVLKTEPAALHANLHAILSGAVDCEELVVKWRPVAAVPLNEISRGTRRLAVPGRAARV